MKVPQHTFCMEFNRGRILQVDTSRFHTNIGVRRASVLIQADEIMAVKKISKLRDNGFAARVSAVRRFGFLKQFLTGGTLKTCFASSHQILWRSVVLVQRYSNFSSEM